MNDEGIVRNLGAVAASTALLVIFNSALCVGIIGTVPLGNAHKTVLNALLLGGTAPIRQPEPRLVSGAGKCCREQPRATMILPSDVGTRWPQRDSLTPKTPRCTVYRRDRVLGR